ncbi:hypothetical protein [Marinicellulosiphila megalodicopiae]|uniref:hypothetical protein n=1 Tax=Marinicellulosiphila megalodicopiae TaxID=2724896 RepID=UPI003BB1DAD4
MRNTIRNLSIIISVIATLIAITNFALAQTHSTDDTSIEHSTFSQNANYRNQHPNPMQQMLQQINLSDTQSEKINEILETSQPDQTTQQRPSFEAHKTLMKQIKSVLSDAQLAQLEKNQSNMSGKRKGPAQKQSEYLKTR